MSANRLQITLLSLFLLGATLPSNAVTPPSSVPFTSYDEPKFPASLAMTPVLEGHATVAFTADASGRVDDAVIVSASHPAFGESVLTAAQTWLLSTDATPPGQATAGSRREMLLYQFHRHGAIVSLNQRDSALAIFSPSLDGAQAIRTVNWRELSAPPARIASPSPKYPAALREGRVAGSTTVSFLIDQTGAVRVPVVIAADQPEFGAAALEAIREWQFAPPTHNGAPVNVEAERRFTFGKSR